MRTERTNGCQGPIAIPHSTVGSIDPFPMGDPMEAQKSVIVRAIALGSLVRMWIIDFKQYTYGGAPNQVL